MMNNQGRPTASSQAAQNNHKTFTGNRALQVEEPLIFETGRLDITGVDIEAPQHVASRLGAFERKGSMGLPGLTEPEAMRHYVRLSQKN